MEWMKPKIKSMIWNIRKPKTTNQNNKKKKRIQNNEDSISASGTTSGTQTFTI